MNEHPQKTSDLTPFQKRVLKQYHSYKKRYARYRVADKNAHLTISKEFKDWLANPLQRDQFKLEVMSASKQVELIEAITKHLQEKRTNKSKETRAANIKRKAQNLARSRQQSFNL